MLPILKLPDISLLRQIEGKKFIAEILQLIFIFGLGTSEENRVFPLAKICQRFCFSYTSSSVENQEFVVLRVIFPLQKGSSSFLPMNFCMFILYSSNHNFSNLDLTKKTIKQSTRLSCNKSVLYKNKVTNTTNLKLFGQKKYSVSPFLRFSWIKPCPWAFD